MELPGSIARSIISVVDAREEVREEKEADVGGGGLDGLGQGVVVAFARGRADRDHRLEQLHVALRLAQDVGRLARVVRVLLLLDRDHAQDRVGVLVVQRELRS